MKVKVTFELDLADTHFNIKKVRNIPVCLQNLGQWLNYLHLHFLENKFDTLVKVSKLDCTYNDAMKKALLEHAEQNAVLSEQLFKKYKVEGVTEDGHKFKFTHQEPGYIEKTTVDDVEVHLEPLDD